MLGNDFVTGLVALLIGYFLGSIPSAFLVTKIFTGKDIRKLGGGNVGGLNTFKEVGLLAAIAVVFIDIGKGIAVILITHYALDLRQVFILISACGAVIGHNWMPWLKFSGGKGMAAAVGAITTIFIIYDFLQALIIFFGIIVFFLIITRNIALSNGIALLGLPFICWLSLHSGRFVIWSVVIGLIIAIKFTPTALRAVAESNSLKGFIMRKPGSGKN